MSVYRRSRSNDGSSLHAVRVLPVRHSLILSVLGEEKRAAPKAMQTLHCDKRARGRPQPRLTDAQTLHIRALREFRGLTAKQIAAETGLPRAAIVTAMEFVNRVHLVPTPEHLTPPAA